MSVFLNLCHATVKCLSDNIVRADGPDSSGFCTQYYRLTVSSSCQFDPELVIPQPRTEVRRSSGTLAPVTTISLLLLGTAVGLVIRFTWFYSFKRTFCVKTEKYLGFEVLTET